MSIQGIRAGKAFVEFLIDDKALDSGLAKVGTKLTNFGKVGLAASAPLIAGFTAAVATFASVGGALDDLHRRTGLSVESLSELSFAAAQSGTDIGVVEKAVKELQKNGIDPLNFDTIAADLASIPNHTERAKKAIEIFGARSGQALLPLLEDLPQLREQARRLGIVMSTEDSQAADRLGDAFDASKAQMVALMAQIGAAIAGPLTEFLQWSQVIVANVIQWVHENPRLVRGIAVVAGAVAAASVALITFGTIMTIITLHPIVLALSLIAGAIAGIVLYFGLASDGAGEFKKELDKVKTPSVSQSQAINAQATQLQSQLQGVQLGNATGPVVSSQAASSAAQFTNEAVSWLKDIAGSSRGTYETLLNKTFGVKAVAL